jgi:hypothetical protein
VCINLQFTKNMKSYRIYLRNVLYRNCNYHPVYWFGTQFFIINIPNKNRVLRSGSSFDILRVKLKYIHYMYWVSNKVQHILNIHPTHTIVFVSVSAIQWWQLQCVHTFCTAFQLGIQMYGASMFLMFMANRWAEPQCCVARTNVFFFAHN